MKQLLLIFLFSGSLDGFSQDGGSGKIDLPTFPPSRTGEVKVIDRLAWVVKSGTDTLRCTLIVYYDKGPAILHTKPGFVVRQFGKEEVYLDDKLRVVKSPLEVFSYKLKCK